MIADVLQKINDRRVDKCLKSNTTYSHEYSKVIPWAEHVKVLPNPRFMCELLHIKRVKYNNFYYTLDMLYLMLSERKVKHYWTEWKTNLS